MFFKESTYIQKFLFTKHEYENTFKKDKKYLISIIVYFGANWGHIV